MITSAKAIIKPAMSFGIMPAPGAERRAERQVAAHRKHQDAEDDEGGPGDVVGAKGHGCRPGRVISPHPDLADLA